MSFELQENTEKTILVCTTVWIVIWMLCVFAQARMSRHSCLFSYHHFLKAYSLLSSVGVFCLHSLLYRTDRIVLFLVWSMQKVRGKLSSCGTRLCHPRHGLTSQHGHQSHLHYQYSSSNPQVLTQSTCTARHLDHTWTTAAQSKLPMDMPLLYACIGYSGVYY